MAQSVRVYFYLYASHWLVLFMGDRSPGQMLRSEFGQRASHSEARRSLNLNSNLILFQNLN